MQSSIERIIDNDRKAREVVAAAEQYRKTSAEKLAAAKAELAEKVQGELAGSIEGAKKRSERETIQHAEEARRNADELLRRMEKLYSEKKNEWVEDYTARIISDRDL